MRERRVDGREVDALVDEALQRDLQRGLGVQRQRAQRLRHVDRAAARKAAVDAHLHAAGRRAGRRRRRTPAPRARPGSRCSRAPSATSAAELRRGRRSVILRASCCTLTCAVSALTAPSGVATTAFEVVAQRQAQSARRADVQLVNTGLRTCRKITRSSVAAPPPRRSAAAAATRRACPAGRAARIRQAVSVGEQRVVVGVALVDGGLAGRPRPRVRQPALEVGDAAVGVAEQHVGDALALGARQPGGDEGVAAVDLAVHPQRPAAEQHRDDRARRGRPRAPARRGPRGGGARAPACWSARMSPAPSA